MKPALSVIFFTVFSGLGLGLAVWLVIGQWCQNCAAGFDASHFFTGAAFVFVFVTLGLISSTLHLANPKNAWRAFSRFRTSWLSREGVLALLFFPLAALHVFLVWNEAQLTLRLVTGALVIACALAILYCTGMIYACLKTIPRWHTWHTPAGYVLYGLTSGVLVFCAIAARGEGEINGWLRLALCLLIASAILYSLANAHEKPEPSLNDALGFTEGRVRLLDVGHTHGTFLTNEFGFRVARARAALLSSCVYLCAFIIPIIIVVIESSMSSQGMLGLAAVICTTGFLVERWLFFAQARHVVMRYHGA
jgi:sulfite dehydrogenase (quinone) subunit SoeC